MPQGFVREYKIKHEKNLKVCTIGCRNLTIDDFKQIYRKIAGSDGLTTVLIKIRVVWYATPYSWVSGSRRFKRTCNTTEHLQLLIQLRSVIQ